MPTLKLLVESCLLSFMENFSQQSYGYFKGAGAI